ncbi:MAG TPA: two-component regulator propeller domain-containing protein [Haliscomenobacter sp.]|uniref:two-component regulator propeller domain-containing protein n=1 Tax=Haliscomenobacter sp. TaxID=2717303 RepID=UPI002BA924FC|nr:two-component regulator propeller domain-containing protein [Haliscomenobacter sp.]HOY17059.1 two-component regulator propeller domain-containing protein [Haliscomenobacter sp.]
MKIYRYHLKFCLFIGLIFNSVFLVAQHDKFVSIPRPLNATGIWITDIKQDHLGYLWVSNPGLARYDGHEWKTYQHDPNDPNTIATNEIESVCPSSNGLVWVGTKGRGLDCLDPTTEKVMHYLLKGNKSSNMNENFITVLREGKDGTLWIGTHDGLYSRDPIKGLFTHYPANPQNPQSLSHHQVRAIFEDRQGTIWVGTGEPTMTRPNEGGLNRLDRKTGRFTQYKANPADAHSLFDNRVRAIFEDSRGTFWVGTYGDGLHTLNRENGQFTRYPYDPAHPERPSRPYPKEGKIDADYGVSFIQEDPKGNIWVGASAGGLLRYNPQNGQATRFNKGQPGGIADDFLWTASMTQEGILCFGTVSGVLMKLVEARPQIPFIKSSSPVQAVYEDPLGNIWLGTFNGLFIKYRHPQTGKFAVNPMEQALKNIRINGILEDKQQRVWCSTWNKGLFCYDLKTGTIRHFQHDPTNPHSISKDIVAWVYQDRADAIWVPTSTGLDRYNPDDQTFTHYRSSPNDSTLLNVTCMNVLEDYTGRLWIGTYAGGVKCLNRKTGKFRHYLNGEIAFQLFEDADQSLWVVTNNGILFRYDRSSDQFKPFEKTQNIKPIAGVKSIIEDNEHNLWLGTRIGIVRLNRERTVSTFFDQNYGFTGGESVYYASCLKASDGKLYFGGNEGAYHFYPEQLKATQVSKPQLMLTTLTLANKPVLVNAKGALPQPLHKTKKLYLNHRQTVFSLGFVAPDIAHPEQIQYKYKLESYDSEWRSGTKRLASYYRVPPGEYVFRVKAANSENSWVERTLMIVVSPPWWQSWWAYSLYIALLIAGVWGMIQYRSAVLQRENRILEEKVALRTNQLQQSLERLQSTQAQLIQSEKLASLGELTAGIAHEIQNPLNFVNNFAEVSAEMLGEMKEEIKAGNTSGVIAIADDLEQNLSKINHHGQRASSIVKGMLEHSRASTGVKEPTDLNALADEYLRLAYHGLRAKDSSFNAAIETHFDPDLPKVEVIPQDIGRVLLNLINNAFYAVAEKAKQSIEGYQPTVTVSTRRLSVAEAENAIEISVKDNGNGVPDNIKDKIFQPFFTTKPTGQGTGLGLSLAYDMVTKGHGGTLKVSSILGEETTFKLQFPTHEISI